MAEDTDMNESNIINNETKSKLEDYYRDLLSERQEKTKQLERLIAKNQFYKEKFSKLLHSLSNVEEHLQRNLQIFQPLSDCTKIALEAVRLAKSSTPVLFNKQTIEVVTGNDVTIGDNFNNQTSEVVTNNTVAIGDNQTKVHVHRKKIHIEPINIKELSRTIEGHHSESVRNNGDSFINTDLNQGSLTTIIEEDTVLESPSPVRKELIVTLTRLSQSTVESYLQKQNHNLSSDPLSDSEDEDDITLTNSSAPEFYSTPKVNPSKSVKVPAFVNTRKEYLEETTTNKSASKNTQFYNSSESLTSEHSDKSNSQYKLEPRRTVIKAEVKRSTSLRNETKLEESDLSENEHSGRSKKRKTEVRRSLSLPDETELQDYRRASGLSELPTNHSNATNSTNEQKTVTKTRKKRKLLKENVDPENDAIDCNRPSRRAKPGCLKEPSLVRKMRRF